MLRSAALMFILVAMCAAQDAAEWRISREFTLDVAKAMPAGNYGFKPSPEQMTFAGQMTHIAGSLVYRFHQMTGAEPPFPLDKPPANAGKDTSIRMLEQAYDYVLAVLPRITPEQMQKPFKVDWKGRPPEVSGRLMILNMFVHAAHHRAQAEVYLRLKGIQPPTYTF